MDLPAAGHGHGVRFRVRVAWSWSRWFCPKMVPCLAILRGGGRLPCNLAALSFLVFPSLYTKTLSILDSDSDSDYINRLSNGARRAPKYTYLLDTVPTSFMLFTRAHFGYEACPSQQEPRSLCVPSASGHPANTSVCALGTRKLRS
eukprot:356623-Chlamydomonas_euryale.AAC.7